MNIYLFIVLFLQTQIQSICFAVLLLFDTIKFWKPKKTSQDLLSRSLPQCQPLTLIVMVWVSQFVKNNQLCHSVTKSLTMSLSLPRLPILLMNFQKGHICLQLIRSALKMLKSKPDSLTYSWTDNVTYWAVLDSWNIKTGFQGLLWVTEVA